MSNQYSIDELARLSPEEVYGRTMYEHERLLEVQADIDMDNNPAYNVGAPDAYDTELRGEQLTPFDVIVEDQWQDRLNEDILF